MEFNEVALEGFPFWSVSGHPSCALGAKCVILDTGINLDAQLINTMKGRQREQRGILVSPEQFRNTRVAELVCDRNLRCVMLLNEFGEQVLVKKLLALQKKQVSH